MGAKDDGWHIGAEVWVVWRNGPPRMETVTAVGRKWVQIGRYRFDHETLKLDGGQYTSPGQAYLSRDEWERNTEKEKAWWRFKSGLAWRAPDHLSLEDINAMIEKVRK